MSGLTRLARLWRAVSLTLRSETSVAHLSQRSRRRFEGALVEGLESRQMLDGTPANIGGVISTTSLNEGQSVEVSVSADGGDDTINYWSFQWGDGTGGDIYSSSGYIDHTYSDSGCYSVYATPHGACTYTDLGWSVTVSDTAPTATFTGGGTVNEGETVTAFSNEYDPSPADAQAGLHYSVAVDGMSLATSYEAAAQSSDITFPDNGYYTVYGRIFDQDNQYTDYYTNVYVNNVAPCAAVYANSYVNQGEWMTVSLGNEYDPSSADTQAGFHYSFAVDGVGLADSYSNAGSNSANLYFPDSGTHSIVGRIFDKDNGYTDYSTSVCVTVVPASISGWMSSTNVSIGEDVTMYLSAWGGETIGSWDVAWGDGTGGDVYGASISVRHTYSDSGNYTVYATPHGAYTYTALSWTVTVQPNVAPTANFIGLTVGAYEGVPNTAYFLNPYDPSPVDTEAGFHYSFAVDNGCLTGDYSTASASPSYQYTFSDSGYHTVGGRIFDAHGGYTDYCETVYVCNVAPTGNLAVNRTTGMASFSGQNDPSPVDLSGLHYSFALDGGWLASTYAEASSGSTSQLPIPSGYHTVYGRIFDQDDGYTEYCVGVVMQSLTSFSIAPDPMPLACDHTHQFIATAYDQYGSPMDTQPTFTWSADDGTFLAAGLYQAPSVGGIFTITAAIDLNHSTTTTVTVVAMADIISVTGPVAPVVEGLQYTLNLSASAGITSWTVNWGDGSAPVTIYGQNGTPTHPFTTAPTGPIYAIATNGTDLYDAAPVYPRLLPIAPTALNGSAVSGHQIDLNWGDNSNIESGYVIEQLTTAANVWVPVAECAANAGTVSLPGPFAPSTTYTFRVGARFDTHDPSANDPVLTVYCTTPFSVTTGTFPQAPDTVRVIVVTPTKAAIRWHNNATNSDGIEVQRRTKPDGPWITLAGSLSPTVDGFTDSTRSSGEDYEYRIMAFNADGHSGYAIGIEQPNRPPVIISPPVGSPVTVTGVSTTLSVSASDDIWGGQLSYAWVVLTQPSGSGSVTFSDAAAATTDVTFVHAGGYAFEVTVTDEVGLSSSRVVIVNVERTVTTLTLWPATLTLNPEREYRFLPKAKDQFNDDIWSIPSVAWAVDSGDGSIDQNGVYTSPSTGDAGTTIRATAPSGATVTATIDMPSAASTGTLNVDDDYSSERVSLGFLLDFLGIRRDQAWVNNNGNITFNSSLATWITQFPLTNAYGCPIIAPFFADVDTRTAGGSGSVTYAPAIVNGHAAFEVDWTDVGYFKEHHDKTNTFSLQLINRSDIRDGDFDIVFHYTAITWETGDAEASDGTRGYNGFGGYSARAGYSNATGTAGTYYELPGSGVNGGLLGLTGTYTYPIRNTALDTLTVREHADSENQAIDAGAGIPELDIPFSADHDASIDLEAAVTPADADHLLRWSIQRSDGQITASGDFTGGMTISDTVLPVAGSATDFDVTVWLDDNKNGQLDAGEDWRLVKTRIVKVDLDIDSDNNDGFASPDLSDAEDDIEDDSWRFGKIISVNDGDADQDGIPDFADGYDWDQTPGTLDDQPPTAAQGEHFTPIVINLPQGIDLSRARLQITYDYSNPANFGAGCVTRTGAGTASDPYLYSPGSGTLRLWTVDGSASRSWKSFVLKTSSSTTGFLVPPTDLLGQYYGPGDLVTLGFTNANRQVTLWVEAVAPSVEAGDQRIQIAVDPDGAGPEGFGSLDAVRLTALSGSL